MFQLTKNYSNLPKNYSEPEATCSNLHKIIQNLRPRIQIYKKKYLEPVRVDDTQAKIQYIYANQSSNSPRGNLFRNIPLLNINTNRKKIYGVY